MAYMTYTLWFMTYTLYPGQSQEPAVHLGPPAGHPRAREHRPDGRQGTVCGVCVGGITQKSSFHLSFYVFLSFPGAKSGPLTLFIRLVLSLKPILYCVFYLIRSMVYGRLSDDTC
jgi:hypothetical protein